MYEGTTGEALRTTFITLPVLQGTMAYMKSFAFMAQHEVFMFMAFMKSLHGSTWA
jgi:hypothetical protein